MSIYDLPEISKIALLHSLTQQNITSGFAVAGISLYNGDVFSDAGFTPSYVTDCPAPQFNAAIDTSKLTSMSDAILSTSGSFVITYFSSLLPVALEFSPGVVRPYQK